MFIAYNKSEYREKLKTHKKVLKSKIKYSGCAVHFVTPVLDSGKIILHKLSGVTIFASLDI